MTGKPIIHRPCWCGHHNAVVVKKLKMADGKRFPLICCGGCGVYTLDPPPTNEELLPYYATEYYGKNRKKFIGPIASFVALFQQGRARLVSKHLPASGRLLDIGCGNGGFLLQMVGRGFHAEGTEWTEQSAQRVPKHPNLKMHVGDLLDLNIDEGHFDAITLWHVFEHVRDPKATLEKINGLLKPGGKLFLSLPNHESTQSRQFRHNWFHLDPPRHLFGFGPKSLRILLEKTGFQIDTCHTWSLEQNPFGYIQSVLNAKGFPNNRAYEVLKGTSDAPLTTKLTDLTRVALLTPTALIRTTKESLKGKGACMTMVIKKS
jgi:SAM-dependent methyltransferase